MCSNILLIVWLIFEQILKRKKTSLHAYKQEILLITYDTRESVRLTWTWEIGWDYEKSISSKRGTYRQWYDNFQQKKELCMFRFWIFNMSPHMRIWANSEWILNSTTCYKFQSIRFDSLLLLSLLLSCAFRSFTLPVSCRNAIQIHSEDKEENK